MRPFLHHLELTLRTYPTPLPVVQLIARSLPPDDEVAALRATFTELDADGSGAISAAELAAALRQLGTAEGSIQQEAQRMMEVGMMVGGEGHWWA